MPAVSFISPPTPFASPAAEHIRLGLRRGISAASATTTLIFNTNMLPDDVGLPARLFTAQAKMVPAMRAPILRPATTPSLDGAKRQSRRRPLAGCRRHRRRAKSIGRFASPWSRHERLEAADFDIKRAMRDCAHAAIYSAEMARRYYMPTSLPTVFTP